MNLGLLLWIRLAPFSHNQGRYHHRPYLDFLRQGKANRRDTFITNPPQPSGSKQILVGTGLEDLSLLYIANPSITKESASCPPSSRL